MTEDIAIYTVRPGGTSLWIPSVLAASMGIEWGEHLTEEQFNGEEIQGLLRCRIIAEKSKRKSPKSPTDP